MKNEVISATPPVATTGLVLWGIPINDWVLILTAVYTIFLIIEKWPVVKQRVKGWFK